MGNSDSITAYNGKQGWLTTPGGVRPMNPAETQPPRSTRNFTFRSAWDSSIRISKCGPAK